MNPSFSALAAGIALGAGAGLIPGPLTTLVLTTSLARGFAAGLRVAVAPLITDAIVIIASVLFLRAVPEWTLQLIAAIGGLYVIYLGIEAIRAARHATLGGASVTPPRADLSRGVMVNLLSPHPWVFWLGVGGPLLIGYGTQSLPIAALFLLGFYLLLVGSKIALAALAAGGRKLLNDTWYRRLLVGSGMLLILMGLLLFREALPLGG
jgi:threonine/homoserine/homoserine lactone efflux protein